tara:strand:- start:55 stop:759 length:705 start_codon:yes stop_codon:yes gene_type:complete
MADKSAKSKWVSALRADIRKECGEGWMVRGIGKGLLQKVQLTVRFEDGQRTSIILGPKAKSDPDFVPWVGTSAEWILNIATEISQTMKSKGNGLLESYELVKKNKYSGNTAKLNWEQLVKKFKSHKTNSGKRGLRIWNRNYRTPIARSLLIITSEPDIYNGYMLLEKLVERHGGEPGSASRRLRIKYAAEFLRFAFKNGANRSWLPPEDLNKIIGQKADNHQPNEKESKTNLIY